MDKRALSIAILGTRGIPNRYGGFEACAEKLGTILVQRGHRVTVYSGSDHPYRENDWHGVRRVMAGNPERWLGTFGQFIYDLNCNLHSRREHFDVVLHLGYTSDSVWYRLWTRNSVHIVNMDGQEWRRSKYSRPVRAFLLHAERMATLRSRWLVADSGPIGDYLAGKYHLPVNYIAYGADVPLEWDEGIPAGMGLKVHGYDLIIARMEPENNIETAIRAKMGSGEEHPLVIVGNDNRYRRYLVRKYGDSRLVRFMEAMYDQPVLNSLRHYCRVYIHGHSVGGTNPSLLEAMACGCAVIAHRNPFNGFVLGEDAVYFSGVDELAGHFSSFAVGSYDGLISRNLRKIREEYNWDAIATAYETLFYDATSPG